MRRAFTRLSLMERELLFAWKEKGISFRVIAKRLRRSHTTISREWKRNTKYFHSYIPPYMAQKRVWDYGYGFSPQPNRGEGTAPRFSSTMTVHQPIIVDS